MTTATGDDAHRYGRDVPIDDAAGLADELLARLAALADPENAAGMARFGISPAVRRAGLVLLCTLAVHDKRAPDERLVGLLPLVEQVADDERQPVSKAASWALRQVGKRSQACHAAAIASPRRWARLM